VSPAAILARWDRIAYGQLCEHAAQLADERDEARDRAYHAEQSAESWRDDFLRLAEETRSRPALTVDGRMVGLPAEGTADG